MTDLQIAKTNYELAIQKFSNNPTADNANFYRLQQRIYDHVRYGKKTLAQANNIEQSELAGISHYYETPASKDDHLA